MMCSTKFAVIPASLIHDSRANNAALAVYAALATHADKEGRCWPSLTTLAKILGVTKQAVSKQIGLLGGLGYVITETAFNGKSNHNVYRLVHDYPLAGDFDRLGRGQPGVDGVNLGLTGGQPGVDYNNKDRTKPTNTLSVGEVERQFTEFRAAYPSRASADFSDPPKAAREKFAALVKKGTDPEVLIRGAKNYAVAVANQRTEPRFVPQMVKWLNNETWTQYQAAPAPKPPTVGLC